MPGPNLPSIPGIIWWILGLWLALGLLVAAAASRWFRFLRDHDQDVYSPYAKGAQSDDRSND